MAKLTWNAFRDKHKNPAGYTAAVSASLPNGPNFDKNKKKLPTPYGLFKEWASASLSGDWASTNFKGGFIVCVESQADSQLISKQFGIIGEAKNTPACENTNQLGYRDSSYGDLAKLLGYKL